MLKMLQGAAFKIHLLLLKSGLLNIRLLDDLFVKSYYFYKRFEAIPVAALRPYIRPDTSVIDIGGGLGFYSHQFAKVVKGRGKVLCFEPELRNFNRIKRFTSKFQNIELQNLACSSKSGTIGFAIDLNNPANHQINRDSEVQVTVVKIDDWYNYPLPISLVKIDVQGHELDVLMGMTETIDHHLPVVLIEIDNRESNTYSRKVMEYFMEKNYTPYTFEKNKSPMIANPSDILEKLGYFDVLFKSNLALEDN